MTVSYSSGVWEVQDQGASRLDVWWRAHFLKDSCLFPVSSHGKRD